MTDRRSPSLRLLSRSSRRLRWFGLPLLLAGVACAQPASTPAQSAPQRAERPYLKLFTLVGEGQLAAEVTGENIRFIAATYGWVNSHGGEWQRGGRLPEYFTGRSGVLDAAGRTVGERLRAANPAIVLTNYRNGAYTNQFAVNEAMEVERDCPLAIAVYDTGAALLQPLGAGGTVARFRPPSAVPAGQPDIYPFKPSTAGGGHTTGKQSYVSWLRLDDEIIRIEGARRTDGVIELTLRRGQWGTLAAPHAADTLVLGPVYCGRVRPDGGEYYLSGLIDGHSEQPAVRYVMQQQHPAYWQFLGGKMAGILQEGVWPWFDCSTSSWINHANGYGVKLETSYDLEHRRPLDRDTLREYQQRKFDALFARFPGAEIYVNWVFPQWWTGPGHEQLMFTGANGHRPLTGAVIEMYANSGHMEWLPLIKMQLDMRDRGIRALSWAKQHGTIGGDAGMSPEYLLFAYCTHLLVHEPDAPQYWGGAWDATGPHGRFTPPDFVYWDLGEPRQRFQDIAEAGLAGTPGVYRRQFAKGFVLVNPDAKTAREVTLEAEAFDPTRGAWVKQVTLAPRTGALLLTRDKGPD